MSSLKGSVILTGANGGLGSAFVNEFLKTPEATLYKGIYTVRDPSTAYNLQAVLKNAPENHGYEVSALDLTALETVRTFAASINSRVAGGSLPRIRALILNAGVEFYGKPNFTNDGIETTFTVNYLANFLIVLLLLQSMDPEHGRIIYVGSIIHEPEKIPWAYTARQSKTVFTDIDKLAKGEETFEEDKEWLWGVKRYGMSKVFMNMFMYELQRRLTADPKLTNISILALDPATVGGTTITRRAPLQTLGEYPKALYVDGTRISDTSPESHDEEKQKRLWEGSLRFAGIKQGDIVVVLRETVPMLWRMPRQMP